MFIGRFFLYLSLLISFEIFASDSCQGKRFHLSFDDGPSLKTTPRIMQTLKDKGISSSFFISSNIVVNEGESRSLLKKMKQEGHEIGSHGFNHLSFDEDDRTAENLKNETAREENIEKSAKILSEFLGDNPIFRLPYGKPYKSGSKIMREKVLKSLGKKGFHHQIGWNSDSRDWEWNPRYLKSSQQKEYKEKFIESVVNNLCGGVSGIMVLHDIKEITADSLPEIIDQVRMRGGDFLSFKGMVDFMKRTAPHLYSNAIDDLKPELMAQNIVKPCQPKRVQPDQSAKRLNDLITNIMESDKAYPHLVGSFLLLENAKDALKASKALGKDCIITQFYKSSDQHFHRVMCKGSY